MKCNNIMNEHPFPGFSDEAGEEHEDSKNRFEDEDETDDFLDVSGSLSSIEETTDGDLLKADEELDREDVVDALGDEVQDDFFLEDSEEVRDGRTLEDSKDRFENFETD